MEQQQRSGQNIVSSAIIDRVAKKLGAGWSNPVGFKWVRRWPQRRLVRASRRGEAPCLVPQAGRIGVDH